MTSFWTALNSGMGRRSLCVVGLVVAALLLAFACVTARDAGVAQERAQAARLQEDARRYAAILDARLEAADAIVDALVDGDAGPDGLLLRERLEASRAFRGLLLLDPDADGMARSGSLAFELTPAQLATVRSGGSVVVSGVAGDDYASLHLLHRVRASGVERIGAFELSPRWLWQAGLDGAQRLHVLGPRGGMLFSSAEDAEGYGGLFQTTLQGLRPGHSRALGWQAGGREWSAAMTAFAPLDGYASPPLAVVAMEPRVPALARLATVGRVIPLLIVTGAGLVLVAAMMLMRAWLPALWALRRGLGDLRAERPVLLRAPDTHDEPRELLDHFNQTAESVQQRVETLRTLGEIDALLLGCSQFEAVLDGVLARIRSVTRCRVAGVTLVDDNAPLHGRIFLAARGGDALPVSRISIDESLVETLYACPQGLTVARSEPGRHSVLQPLIVAGANFFWVWPVFAGERLGAILAVGYEDPAQADASLAAYGTECALRVGAALSSSARAEALYRQAHFDPLTQLPNRVLFRDRLAQDLATVMAESGRGALLYVDLDHFKKINDSLGHDAGDQLLSITAQRLRACVKEGDTVARLAGDEFTVILRQVSDPASAAAVAERIIESLQMPVHIGGQDHHVRASIGVALYPDDGVEIDELMRNADLAMYRAKAMGRGKAAFFDRRMAMPNRIADSGLHRALKRREFSLYYQPQYNLADGSLVGIEALLRWQSTRDGLRGAQDFVPAAEESGLMVDIGGWVLEAACAQLAAWRAQGLEPPRIAVNLAPQQLRDREIVALTRRMLDKYGLPGSMLEFELKEGALADPDAASTLPELARLGVGLTLDDFGTGDSALGHLRRYPVRAVKIDRSFIENITDSSGSAALAETIIVMAHNLGKQVIAEGVETIEQLDFLRERGCDIVQGYYLARPLAAPAMAELLEGRRLRAHQGSAVAAG